MSRWDFRKERWVRVRVVWKGEAFVAEGEEVDVRVVGAFLAEA